jgi:hypothetical protein
LDLADEMQFLRSHADGDASLRPFNGARCNNMADRAIVRLREIPTVG